MEKSSFLYGLCVLYTMATADPLNNLLTGRLIGSGNTRNEALGGRIGLEVDSVSVTY